jgi:hypothetical protein
MIANDGQLHDILDSVVQELSTSGEKNVLIFPSIAEVDSVCAAEILKVRK